MKKNNHNQFIWWEFEEVKKRLAEGINEKTINHVIIYIFVNESASSNGPNK